MSATVAGNLLTDLCEHAGVHVKKREGKAVTDSATRMALMELTHKQRREIFIVEDEPDGFAVVLDSEKLDKINKRRKSKGMAELFPGLTHQEILERVGELYGESLERYLEDLRKFKREIIGKIAQFMLKVSDKDGIGQRAFHETGRQMIDLVRQGDDSGVIAPTIPEISRPPIPGLSRPPVPTLCRPPIPKLIRPAVEAA